MIGDEECNFWAAFRQISSDPKCFSNKHVGVFKKAGESMPTEQKVRSEIVASSQKYIPAIHSYPSFVHEVRSQLDLDIIDIWYDDPQAKTPLIRRYIHEDSMWMQKKFSKFTE